MEPVPQPEWLVDEMMNMNRQIVTRTNEEVLGIPSFPSYLINEVVHYYMHAYVEKDTIGIRGNFWSKMGLIRKCANNKFCELKFKNQQNFNKMSQP